MPLLPDRTAQEGRRAPSRESSPARSFYGGCTSETRRNGATKLQIDEDYARKGEGVTAKLTGALAGDGTARRRWSTKVRGGGGGSSRREVVRGRGGSETCQMDPGRRGGAPGDSTCSGAAPNGGSTAIRGRRRFLGERELGRFE